MNLNVGPSLLDVKLGYCLHSPTTVYGDSMPMCLQVVPLSLSSPKCHFKFCFCLLCGISLVSASFDNSQRPCHDPSYLKRELKVTNISLVKIVSTSLKGRFKEYTNKQKRV